MTSIVEGARRDLAPQTALDARVAALGEAVDLLKEYGDEPAVAEAAEVFQRSSTRLRLSADHTVVALAGATGSGKSSTFNALTGLDIAATGVRRPTTSWSTACIWGAQGAEDLLKWLGIPLRHQVVRDSMLDTRREASDLAGLVLLDLPDHDSTEVAHHLEVDRLIQLADVLVVVLDPQKYADAAVHDRLLRPFVDYAGVMVAVLNHIDEVEEDERDKIIADARRLLDAGGLASVPLLVTAASLGEGIPELRAELARRVAVKADSRARISTDLSHAAAGIGDVLGPASGRRIDEAEAGVLRDAVLEGYGVDHEVARIESAARTSVKRATVWPPFLAPAIRRQVVAVDGQVAPLEVEARIRDAAVSLASGTGVWEQQIRETTVGGIPSLRNELGSAVTRVFGHSARPGWAVPVGLLQWVSFLAAVGGGAWWVVGQSASGAAYKWQGLPVGLIVAIAAAVIGLVVMGVGFAAASGIGARSGTSRREEFGRAALTALSQSIIDPANALLNRRADAVDAVRRASADQD